MKVPFALWQDPELDHSASLVDLLQGPVETAILGQLSAADLSNLACTSRSLLGLVKRADPRIWQQTAMDVLGPQHPAFDADQPISIDKLHEALKRDSQACHGLQHGKYTLGESQHMQAPAITT